MRFLGEASKHNCVYGDNTTLCSCDVAPRHLATAVVALIWLFITAGSTYADTAGLGSEISNASKFEWGC